MTLGKEVILEVAPDNEVKILCLLFLETSLPVSMLHPLVFSVAFGDFNFGDSSSGSDNTKPTSNSSSILLGSSAGARNSVPDMYSPSTSDEVAPSASKFCVLSLH
jgi:hypothetical protein